MTSTTDTKAEIAERNGRKNTGDSYESRPCPLCGEEDIKKLPSHLRHRCPETAEVSHE